MAEMRIGHGWSTRELSERLARIPRGSRSFAETSMAEMRVVDGWRPELAEAVIAVEAQGPPVAAGPYARARRMIGNYAFSDPSLVRGHFDRREPLLGRRILLELKVLGLFFLAPVEVDAAFEGQSDAATWFGFRIVTLPGHVERGAEWFVVYKAHHSGEVRARIESRWRRGDLPNWWMRLGFGALAPFYRALWIHRAFERLCSAARSEQKRARRRPSRRSAATHLAHMGPASSELPRVIERREPGFSAALTALSLGALTGLRSMSGPALLSWHCVRAGPQPGAGLLERSLCRPGVAGALTLAAVLELFVDKLPGTGARIAPLPMLARLALSMSCATVDCERSGSSKAAAMVGGAIAAGLFAHAGYRLRSRLRKAWNTSFVLSGILEDVILAGGALVLGKALSHRSLPSYLPRTRPPRDGWPPLASEA